MNINEIRSQINPANIQSAKAYRQVVRGDCYRMNVWPNNFFDDIFDIGANVGMFTVYAHMRHPQARIFAYEPCQETFTYLVQNTFYLPGVYYFNEALGYGDEMGVLSTSDLWGNMCLPKCDKDFAQTAYTVPGTSLSQMFESNQIDLNRKYLIKIDCEGGERALLKDTKSVEIVRNAACLCMEIHFPPYPPVKLPDAQKKWGMYPRWEVWEAWINLFKATHTIQYGDSDKHRGYGIYILTKREVKDLPEAKAAG